MEAQIIGFKPRLREAILEALPVLSAYSTVFLDVPSLPLADEVKIVVLSSPNCDHDLISRIIGESPGVTVFCEAPSCGFYRASGQFAGAINTDEALATAAKIKDLSLKLRHDVRSPIQTIHDSAERLHQKLLDGDEAGVMTTLSALQKSATRVMQSIPRFSVFHKELEKLIAQLSNREPRK